MNALKLSFDTKVFSTLRADREDFEFALLRAVKREYIHFTDMPIFWSLRQFIRNAWNSTTITRINFFQWKLLQILVNQATNINTNVKSHCNFEASLQLCQTKLSERGKFQSLKC